MSILTRYPLLRRKLCGFQCPICLRYSNGRQRLKIYKSPNAISNHLRIAHHLPWPEHEKFRLAAKECSGSYLEYCYEKGLIH